MAGDLWFQLREGVPAQRLEPLADRGAAALWRLRVMAEAEDVAARVEQGLDLERELAGLTKAPGFISWLGMVIAGRMYTLTAWESADAVQEIMRNHVHQGAVRQFFSERFLTAGTTGVWVPHHLNPVRVRCASCGSLSEATPEAGATCSCGHPLPQVQW